MLAIIVAVLLSLVGPTTHPSGMSDEGFSVEVSRIPRDIAREMKGVSWHRGCPVPIRRLRLMLISYHGFDGERHIGRLVAHKNAVQAFKRAFRSMWRHDFKLKRMHRIERYGGSDRRSMRRNNTSAFNCRTVAGTNHWSQHAFGRAIDINPVQNPYVRSDGSVVPRKGERFADRSRHHKGMIHAGDSTVRAFSRSGWGWGGYWSSSKDYQHFSATGT